LQVDVPRLLVAGLRGGGGKTLISLGLAATWRKQGQVVAPFKKGPDYIDAAWLTRAADRACRNLDLFFFSPSVAIQSFLHATRDADIALIEGNRGLYDGMDPEGSYSSGELAKLLKAPVLLVVDGTKTTRTAAAQVLGCQTLDPEVPLAGVVLNRVAGSRHETVLRQSIEGICGIPVLGAIPRLPYDLFPERHLGLVPPQETGEVGDLLVRAGETAENYLDLDGILALARGAPKTTKNHEGIHPALSEEAPTESTARIGVFQDAAFQFNHLESPRVKIGLFRDAAFQFYYPENLEALVSAGGELVNISPLQDGSLPLVDALYLGGGFPETLAVGLSENRSFMGSLREAAEEGLPIYAECGGAVYLGERLHYEGRTYPLAGILPVEYGFQGRPRGHGYTVLETVAENPFFSVGENLRGHEFHYTFMISPEAEGLSFAFRVHRGHGFDGLHDGLCLGNVLASYTHIHALGAVDWAPSLVKAAVGFKTR
jgi:cobyrinic acid a,c-diamide synthase